MRKIFILLFPLVILTLGVFSQEVNTAEVSVDNTKPIKQDTIEDGITQDIRLYELVDKHKKLNKKRKGMTGYRIQIFFDSGNNSKHNANSAKSTFITNYPAKEVYLLFEAPNYKIRVGDFRTRMDALVFLKEMQSEYPDEYANAFIVKGEINFPTL